MQLKDLARRLPDDIWAIFDPILPAKVWSGNGRPPCGNRECLHALLYVLASGIGLRRNPRRGWGLLAAGSTPRIVLSIVVGGAAFWFATSVLDSPGDPPTRAAAVIVIGLGSGRLLSVRDPRAALAAASLIALGAGTLEALATTDATGALIGSIAAVALNLIPTAPESEARGG